MSLIEEALRKQREETEKARGGFTGQTPPVAPPPPLPGSEEPVSEEPAPVHKALPVLIGAVVGGIIVVAVIVWVLLYGFNFRFRSTVEKPAVANAVVTGPAATSTVVVAATSAPAVVVTAPVVTPVVVQPEPVPVVVATSAPVVVAEAPVVTIGNATAVTAVVATEPAVAVQKISVVVWPKLTVTGLIGAARAGKSVAIINGQMVTPGTVVEGVKIESIDGQGVKLRYEGEIRTLSVGGTTE